MACVLIVLSLTFSGFSSEAATPTSQPTAIVFSNRTINSITVSFTNAADNPKGYLLIYESSSSPTTHPVNGTVYSVGNNLGSGTVGAVGTGPFTITGLSVALNYFFAIYSYNGSGSNTKYLVSITPLEGNAWTIAAAPTADPKNLIFSGITDTGFNGSFSAASPIPTGGYIGLRKAGSAVTDTPIDGTVYSVGGTIGASTISFIGPSLSFSESNLASATTYYYKIFSNGLGADPSTANYHTSGTPLVNNQTTLASPASVQASNIVFSGAANNQLTLTWTNGNGGRRVVLGHAGAAVNSNPVDASTYIANPLFGTGTELGSGNYSVYDGTGSSFTVTGLIASTVYYFEVFEYNGIALTTNYLTTSAAGNPANQTTLATPATNQATNILFSAVSNTQMTLNWTRGNGSNLIVLALQGSPVNSNPLNSTAYTANQVYGSGNQIGSGNFVVYNGSGSAVTVTGLISSTDYYFEAFEYTGAGATLNYLTPSSSGNPNNESTLAGPATVQASNIFFGNLSNNAMTVNWANGNGARRMVLAHAGAAINSGPVAETGYTANSIFGSGSQIGTGNYVVYDGTGNSAVVTGLSATTSYYFEVYEYNGLGVTANYLTTTAAANPSQQITLANPAVTQASNIVFSAISSTQFSIGWTNGSGTNRLVLVQAGSQSDDVVANGASYSANSVFGSGTALGSHYAVYNGTGNSVAVSGLLASVVYFVEVLEYDGSGITANYLTSVASGNPASQSTLALPVTTQSSAIVFSSTSNNQTTLTWTNGSGANRIVLAHANTTIDSNPLNFTAYVADTTFGAGSQIGTGNYVVYEGPGNTATVTGLFSASLYYYRVFDYNGSGADNRYDIATTSANPAAQLTLTDAPVAYLATSIDSSSFVASWSMVSGSTGYFIDISTDNFTTFVPGFNNLAVAGTTLSGTGLTGGGSYQYQVRAEDATGPSADSNPISVLLAPIAPVPLACTGISPTSFTANWNISNGATNYFLDVSTDINFGSFLPGFNSDPLMGINSATVSGLTAGTIYHYRVRAENASGTSGNSVSISQITVPAIPVVGSASNQTPLNFAANWTIVPGADSYELDVTLGSSNFSTFVAGYNAKYVPDSTQAQEVIGLTSNTIYKYRVRARNAGGVSGNSVIEVAITSGGGPVIPPTIQVTSSSNTDIKVQAADGYNPLTNTITFFHRPIIGAKFTQEPATTGSTADITVNASWLDQLGMEYYFRVSDEADNEDSTASQYIYSQVSNVNLSSQANFVGGGTPGTYRIFSIPVMLSSNQIEDVFQSIIVQYGGIDKTKWRLVQYQAGQNIDYGTGLNTIDPGRGYWFNSLDAPQPIDISGSVIQANQAQGFIMSLDAGFTQIGNPYPFSISWNDILAQNSNVTGILDVGALYTFDAAQVAFIKNADILDAWGGGFVHSNAAIQLTIPVTVNQGTVSGRTTNSTMTSSIDQPQWFVPIAISEGNTSNNYSGPGMNPAAQIGYDRFDDFTLPRFISYLEMNSYHPDYLTPKFSRDIVPTATHYNWDFEVESNIDDHNVVMTWNNQALGDNAAQLLLYDAGANMIMDMKKVSSYRFEINEKHLFRIFFGVDENSLSPDVTALGRAYPNPFAQRTAIPFITGANQPDVQIEVYDMMGRKIREIENGEFESGYHEGSWDGTDDRGGRAAPGVYIYRLTSSTMAAQMGRVVLE